MVQILDAVGSGAAKFEYRWKADFSCPCYIEYFDIRIYMEIFEFTWRQNHGISNALFPDLHVFRNITISAIFEYTWFSYHIYSIIYGTKTMYIRKYMMAWHVISNMEIGIFDIYFSHTIEYRICSSLFFGFSAIYIQFSMTYRTIENRISPSKIEFLDIRY